MDFQRQPAGDDDQSFLAELYSDVRAPEFLAAGLPAASLGPLLAMQFRAQTRGYADQFPAAVNEIVWIGGERAGRILVSTTAAEIHLVDVALLARFRGHGVGTQLVGGLCEHARAAGLPLRLSVQAGNPARRLYERMGFVVTGGDSIYLTMELGEPQSAVPQSVAPIAASAEGQTAVAPALTRAYFETLRGRGVRARNFAGLETELDVVEVKPLAAARGPAVDVGDSFKVELTSPLHAAFGPETIEIAAASGEWLALFVSPLGPLNGVMQYEAIFNRSRLVS